MGLIKLDYLKKAQNLTPKCSHECSLFSLQLVHLQFPWWAASSFYWKRWVPGFCLCYLWTWTALHHAFWHAYACPVWKTLGEGQSSQLWYQTWLFSNPSSVIPIWVALDVVLPFSQPQAPHLGNGNTSYPTVNLSEFWYNIIGSWAQWAII